jgi:hypothetical protein
MMASISTNTKESDERTDARWKAMMQKKTRYEVGASERKGWRHQV